ncbi:MAG TPA: VCBS repeat-containing protein, partial [Tahibacter sp.]|nr:VCBS repeat-containing protein [Tahibacter sp.]
SRADAVAIGDVTDDGRNDVVMTTTGPLNPVNDYRVFVFAQRPFAGTLEKPAQVAYGQTPTYSGLALGNFDGVPGVDVAVGGNAGVSVFTAAATAPWLSPVGIVASQHAQPVVALDLDADGAADLASTGSFSGGNTYANDGAAHFTPSYWPTPATGYNRLAVGDLDGDGDDDIAVAADQGPFPNVTLHRANGDGTLTPFGTLDAGCDGWGTFGIGIGDLDGDAVNDIVATSGGNGWTACLLVFHGNGNGTYAPPLQLASYDMPEALVVADMNRDRRADVVVLHAGWQRVGVYLQQANGTLAPELLYPIPYASHYNAQGLAVGDFSGDGCPDVAIGDYNFGLVTLTNGMACPHPW